MIFCRGEGNLFGLGRERKFKGVCMFARIFSKTRFLFPLLLALFAIFLTGWMLVAAPMHNGAWLEAISLQSQ
ncbi:MAG TPA: hypothetical protein DIU08_01060, partial [Ktedonobacter sp.]|nr:hypothetical protein [Ktedonobacter sp.]